MTPEENQKIIDYVESFSPPAEKDFFPNSILEKIKKNREKLDSSRQIVSSVIEKDDFDMLLQKAVLEGRAYAPAEARDQNLVFAALEDADGERVDISESLISPTGERIIMSGRLQKILGLISDTYIEKDEGNSLMSALQADGVPSPEIDKVNKALNKNGAVLMQRGIFLPLKGLLEESVGHRLELYVDKTTVKSPKPYIAMPAGVTAGSLKDFSPALLEYIKKNDLEYPKWVSEVSSDEKFKGFFSGLQKNYEYYKNLSISTMADEVALHPALWMKLSMPNKAKIESIVQKNQDAFNKAASGHGTSINDLKARLVDKPQEKPKFKNPAEFNKELKKEVNTPELDSPPAEPPPPEIKIPAPPPKPPIDPKTSWMLTENVIAPKGPRTAPPKARRVPKVRSRIARFGLQQLGDIRSVDDLEKIEAAHLRQGPLEEQIAIIRSKIQQLAKSSGLIPINLLPIFEKSPLFQIYLNAGSMLIEKNMGSSQIAFDEVMADFEEKGEDILTQQEFEAVADLKKDLERIAGL